MLFDLLYWNDHTAVLDRINELMNQGVASPEEQTELEQLCDKVVLQEELESGLRHIDFGKENV